MPILLILEAVSQTGIKPSLNIFLMKNYIQILQYQYIAALQQVLQYCIYFQKHSIDY